MPRRYYRSQLGRILFLVILAAIVAVRWYQAHWQPSPPDQLSEGVEYEVERVVDGDTLLLTNHARVRLLGIDTPETKNPKTGVMYFGPEAAEFTKKLALGKPVTVYLDKNRTRDKYDRLLAYIKLPDGGFLNEVLLTEGFAYADLRFKHDFYNKYKQLESVARSQKKGLWLEVTPEQWPEWRQRRQSSTAEVAEVNN